MKNLFVGKFLVSFLLISLFVAALVSCSYQPDFDYKEYLENAEDVVVKKDGSAYIISPDFSETEEVPVSALIFYPGAYVKYESYLPLLIECAKNGVECILVEMPSDLAILDKNAAKKFIKNPKYSYIENWYLGGHSLGGAMAAVYASKKTEYFKGLILLAAYSIEDLTNSGLKVLSVYGSEDGVLKKEKYSSCLANLPADYEEHVLEGGNHANFGDYGAQNGDNPATMSSEEQKRLTAEYIGHFCYN